MLRSPSSLWNGSHGANLKEPRGVDQVHAMQPLGVLILHNVHQLAPKQKRDKWK